MAFIDTHCHLDFAPFNRCLGQRLKAWQAMGICGFVAPAVGPSNWSDVLTLGQLPQIKIALGYHPCFLAQYQGGDRLEQAVATHRANLAALGECGLDGRFPEQLVMQQEVFDVQISLAKQYGLPLIVHSVRCHDLTAKQLKQQGFDQGGVIHAFSGSYQQASRFVDLGFKLGVGGGISWPRGEKTRKTISKMPLSSLVLETDAPDMPLYQMPFKHNSPSNLGQIFDQLKQLRHEPAMDVMGQLLQTSQRLFHFN